MSSGLVDEIQGAYPGAADAVLFVVATYEWTPGDPRDLFQALMVPGQRIDGVPVEQLGPPGVTDFIKRMVDDEIQTNDHGDLDLLIRVRTQMDHPDFARYVAAKMGAV